MAFIRNCFVITMALLCVLCTHAQTVSYPVQSSRALKSTAEDAALLLQKAIATGLFNTAAYTALPATGIIFIYDSAITQNQSCRVESDGISFIKFSASQDNGLFYGVYQYLHHLGFRFYLPGSVWEIIPSLSSPYKKTDTTFTADLKYNNWFLSGGHNRWIMDNNAAYGWDTYFGDNGHNWSLYQRRNGMAGEYRFAGHRADIIGGSNLSTWQNNPCYIASYNNSRIVNGQSVPDVNNASAMQLWSSIIEQKYTAYRNTVFSNINFFINSYRNFNFNSFNVGIEVPDGAQWGNTSDVSGCNNNGYSKESDQNIMLANYTANKIGAKYPGIRFQLYAYSTHADIPSENIPVSEKLDIQLIPAVYQNVTSVNGLRNRWYKRTKNLSEYNYLNLSGWNGETPTLNLKEFKATLQIAKEKKSQGLVWEASPAKFASLPFLFAANKNLKENIPVDSTLVEFCNTMFAAAGKTVYSLLQLWTDDKSQTGGILNRYKMQLYLQTVNTAEQQIMQEPPIVKQRLRELKAYLHYMVLYYDWTSDQRSAAAKMHKTAALCLYLAKINKLQLVNSYYLIFYFTSSYTANSDFYRQYNQANGTAYQNGNLALITNDEIDADFRNDLATFSNTISKFQFESASFISTRLASAGLDPAENIMVQLGYTNGMDYYNKSEFYIKAPAAGTFVINYNPLFEMQGKGYINFTVESTDNALEIIEDFSLDGNAKAGSLRIALPAAGNYKLTVCSKYKSKVTLNIITNKNLFYKSGVFFGKATESYALDTDKPGYLYIPQGIDKVYFSLGNSNAGGKGFKNEAHINNAFLITDHDGKILKARFVTPYDSALFYIDIPKGSSGKFCRIIRKYYQYSLVFSNISNYLWFAVPKPLPCSNADFTVDVINREGNCITRLTATVSSNELEWEVADLNKTYTFSKERVIELPDYISTASMVTLKNGKNCSVTKKLNEDKDYIHRKQQCEGALTASEFTVAPVIYPNPSSGIFKLMQNGLNLVANQVFIFNTHGNLVKTYTNISQFNISHVPAGIYWYKILVKGAAFSGKLLKL